MLPLYTAPVRILEQMDKQRITGSIFIDLKKAIDLVDHHRLLHKLEHYGIGGESLKCSNSEGQI